MTPPNPTTKKVRLMVQGCTSGDYDASKNIPVVFFRLVYVTYTRGVFERDYDGYDGYDGCFEFLIYLYTTPEVLYIGFHIV